MRVSAGIDNAGPPGWEGRAYPAGRARTSDGAEPTGSARPKKGPARLEVDLEAGLHDVAPARDADGKVVDLGAPAREVREDVVEHDPRVREQVPVDPGRDVRELAAADVA